jgi:hypothetical protein
MAGKSSPPIHEALRESAARADRVPLFAAALYGLVDGECFPKRTRVGLPCEEVNTPFSSLPF